MIFYLNDETKHQIEITDMDKYMGIWFGVYWSSKLDFKTQSFENSTLRREFSIEYFFKNYDSHPQPHMLGKNMELVIRGQI